MFDYNQESFWDVMARLTPLQKRGGCHLREDGKIGFKGQSPWDVPWIHTVFDEAGNCTLAIRVLFTYFGFIPIRCLNCWKVVVRPRTLKELFALLEIQEQLQHSSKAGIEERLFVFGLYGGYFYNKSVRDGRECKEKVRQAVSAEISPDVPVILKRGCSEIELKYPNTQAWELSAGQEKFEEYLNDLFVLETHRVRQHEHPHLIRHVKRKWVEFAYHHGDETYLEFTGGQPLFPPYKTY